MENSFPGTVSA
jgi:hypothetical protein